MAGNSKYSIAFANEICALIATSNRSMKSICDELNMSVRTVQYWIETNAEFRQMYAHAKEQQADFLAEEIIEIADDGSKDLAYIDDFGNAVENKEFVNRSRLRVDARKWVAAHLRPKKYGDKIDVTTDGESLNKPDYSNLTTEELNTLLALQKKTAKKDAD